MSRLDVAFRPKMWKPCVTLCCCLLGPRAETRIEKREIIPPRLFTTNSLVTTLTQFTSVEERTYSQMMVKTYLSSATTLVLVHGLLKFYHVTLVLLFQLVGFVTALIWKVMCPFGGSSMCWTALVFYVPNNSGLIALQRGGCFFDFYVVTSAVSDEEEMTN